jgi:hypothetical protein
MLFRATNFKSVVSTNSTIIPRRWWLFGRPCARAPFSRLRDRGLLLVVLDDVRVAHARHVGILAGVPPRAPLA